MIAPVLAAMLLATAAPGAPAPPARPGPALAAPSDTLQRVPGTWLRFGHSPERVVAHTPFTIVGTTGPAGEISRRGALRWFGIDGEATLTFLDGRLARVRISVKDAAPHWLDYPGDQLRRAGYRARCERSEPALRLCDWEGACRVRLEIRERAITADLTPAPPRPPPRPPAPPDTVPILPEIFVLGGGTAAGSHPIPQLAESWAPRDPEYPRAARDAGVQGRVWVRALVDTLGAVIEAACVRSIPELDSVALAFAREYRFRPYVLDSRKVRFRVEIPVTFTLH